MNDAPRRPLFHFAPSGAWMNDPNGPFWHDGQWHLFYQRSETPPDYRVIGWGHAVSEDLLRWTDLGWAIPPDELGFAYSGSVIATHPGALEAFFTRHDPRSGRQTQEHAASRDGGMRWQVTCPRPLLDEGLTNFRDPFLVQLTDGSWRMILVKPVGWHDWRSGRSRFALYRSENLRDWQPISPFGPQGRAGELFEVPLLLRTPVEGQPDEWRWLLVTSIVDRAKDGTACRVVAWIGDLVDDDFVVEAGPVPLDHGPDFYAATSFAGLPERDIVLVGWLGSWAYARKTPTDAPLGGTQSIPRTLGLRRSGAGLVLVQRPKADAAVLAASRLPLSTDLAAERRYDAPMQSTSYVAKLTIVFRGAATVEVSLRRCDTHRTLLTLDRATRTMTLDRTASGDVAFDPAFADASTAPLPLREGDAELVILVDRCSVEVFAGDGEAALTAQIFPPPDADRLGLLARGGSARATGEIAMLDGGPAS